MDHVLSLIIVCGFERTLSADTKAKRGTVTSCNTDATLKKRHCMWQGQRRLLCIQLLGSVPEMAIRAGARSYVRGVFLSTEIDR